MFPQGSLPSLSYPNSPPFSVVQPWTGPFPSLSLSAWQENAHNQSHSLQEAAGLIQPASTRQCLQLSLRTPTFLLGEITRPWDNCLKLGGMNVFFNSPVLSKYWLGFPASLSGQPH